MHNLKANDGNFCLVVPTGDHTFYPKVRFKAS